MRTTSRQAHTSEELAAVREVELPQVPWYDSIFRADFLAYLKGSRYQEAVKGFGVLLANVVREHANYLGGPREPAVVCDLRAVAVDLRHSVEYLGYIADGDEELDELVELRKTAVGLADQVAEVVRQIEIELERWSEEEHERETGSSPCRPAASRAREG